MPASHSMVEGDERRGREEEREKERKKRKREREEVQGRNGREWVRKSAKGRKKSRKEKERVGGRKAEEGRSKTPTIDQKEEGASLIGHGTSNESLSGARGSVKQDSSRRLHTNGSEQLGVA